MTDYLTILRNITAIGVKAANGEALETEEFMLLEEVGRRDDLLGRKAKRIRQEYVNERTEAAQ